MSNEVKNYRFTTSLEIEGNNESELLEDAIQKIYKEINFYHQHGESTKNIRNQKINKNVLRQNARENLKNKTEIFWIMYSYPILGALTEASNNGLSEYVFKSDVDEWLNDEFKLARVKLELDDMNLRYIINKEVNIHEKPIKTLTVKW